MGFKDRSEHKLTIAKFIFSTKNVHISLWESACKMDLNITVMDAKQILYVRILTTNVEVYKVFIRMDPLIKKPPARQRNIDQRGDFLELA
jgi:hypothetical protein